MYWPYEQHDPIVNSVTSAGRAVAACMVRSSVFSRSDQQPMKNLQDPTPIKQESWMTTSFRQAVFQPINTLTVSPNPLINMAAVLNQSTLISHLRRAVNMGLDQEHEQPACSR